MTKLRFVRREYWGGDVWEYFFQLDDRIEYIAGQYASFSIPGVNDPRSIARTFTMTSLPSDELLSFAVKITEGASPYKVHLARLKPGEAVFLGEPMGDLIKPRDAETPLLFVAGGLGIASYISMLREHGNAKVTNPVSLLWAVRSRADQYDLPILATIAPDNQQVFVAPERLHIDAILSRTTPDTHIYLSGSENFVSSLRIDLHAYGITDTRILFDYFSGYNEL